MAQASEPPASTIDPREAEHFGKLAADWWDPKGSSAMLHKLNPARLGYIRDQIERHWSADETSRRPRAGKRAADVGCGAGLLAEPLARLGAQVTAVDAAEANIEAARAHALGQGLEIDYRVGGVEALDARYDLVCSLEVIEHVADVRGFVRGLAGALAEDVEREVPAGRQQLAEPEAARGEIAPEQGLRHGRHGRSARGHHRRARFALSTPRRCSISGHRLLS